MAAAKGASKVVKAFCCAKLPAALRRNNGSAALMAAVWRAGEMRAEHGAGGVNCASYGV